MSSQFEFNLASLIFYFLAPYTVHVVLCVCVWGGGNVHTHSKGNKMSSMSNLL